MKVNFVITGNDNNDYELSVEWVMPYLPRQGECIFLDNLFEGMAPKEILDCMFHIDAIDWRWDEGLKFLIPTIWVSDIEKRL